MSDETGAAFTMRYSPIVFSNIIYVNKVVVRANSQVLSIRRILHLMKDFLPVLNMSDLSQCPTASTDTLIITLKHFYN